jgi:hypothetical protein
MSKEQSAELRRLAGLAFEHDVFKPNLTAAQAALRIAALKSRAADD